MQGGPGRAEPTGTGSKPVFHSRQRGFQCSDMAHTMPRPQFLNGPRMDSEHFVWTEEKQGDLLYSGPCAS